MNNHLDKRHERRCHVSEQGLLISQDGMTHPITVHVTDISEQGIGIIAHSFFALRNEYILKYSFPHRDYYFLVEVQWSQYEPHGYYAGCRKITEIVDHCYT
jgi:hypothetical protein